MSVKRVNRLAKCQKFVLRACLR